MPVELSVRERSVFGSSESRRLRRGGQVPGIVYGKGAGDIAVVVDEKHFMTVVGYSTASGLLDLVYTDKDRKTSVIVKDVQWDPLSDRPVHIDFLRVSADQMVSIPVHVHLENTPQGVLMGGVLEHILHEVVIKVKAADIPHAINVNVEHLDIGDSLHIDDMEFPDGVTPDMAGELVVATVVPPTVAAVEEEPEEELEEGEEAEAAEGEEAETGESAEGEESEQA
jgi:large subunit ribosomal protein L25